MVWQRIRNHPGLAALLVFLLVLPAPLVWLGTSTNLLEPVLYSAVIEADMVFDADCNMVSRQVTRELGQQDHRVELAEWTVNHDWHSLFHTMALTDKGWSPNEMEALASDAGISSCVEYAGELFTTRAKLWRTWRGLMSLNIHDGWEMEIEPVQG